MTTRGERIIVRSVAGLALLLLWLCLPASAIAWIFTGDSRWVAAGLIAFLTGFAVAWVLHAESRRS